MEKKVKIIIAAMVCILVIGKTGFAYYENNLNKSKKEAIGTMEEKNTDNLRTGDNDDEITPELVINLGEVNEKNSLNEETKLDTLSEEEEVSACCASVTVNMFNENGNIKNREQFEEELNGYYESGKINLEDLEYYLFMYNKSAETYDNEAASSESNSELEGVIEYEENNNFAPSCH